MPNLKQGTLSFASAKRTNSIYNGKKTLVTEKGKVRRVERPVEVQDDAEPSEAIETFSDEEDAATAKISVKRTRTSTKTRPSSATAKQGITQSPSSEKEEPSRVGIEGKHLDVEDKAGRYRNYYNEVRSKMGYIQPVHSDGQNKIHQMLRFFDMSYGFGPCIGMTRLERWERAEAFGLNPPVEVRDILLTKEGIEKVEYAQCVLHGEV
ncbi:DNA polymerase delta, subunit 4-domain-containing protein [Boletus edulis BED1]|uniref:DNA polymerase delta, subunit 4-domain-containing protein n=1 Tax=Boletus edulis BED1 TaxID=1328754 RepID=A0AAD4GK61_BOLED|nr:DNA polymerase delta, subunit 4-domain-containing protein [Boletus edulis BED1]